jgi:5-methyltetrahydropteroyltriglutamate--homocysteine methyltransferase
MLFSTTIAGFPKPSWLAETERLWPQWRQSGEALGEASSMRTRFVSASTHSK